MTSESLRGHVAKISVETVDHLTERDINELSDAAEAAILSGGGFGWLLPPPKSVMEDYWRGVQMIPDRHLIIARLDISHTFIPIKPFAKFLPRISCNPHQIGIMIFNGSVGVFFPVWFRQIHTSI